MQPSSCATNITQGCNSPSCCKPPMLGQQVPRAHTGEAHQHCLRRSCHSTVQPLLHHSLLIPLVLRLEGLCKRCGTLVHCPIAHHHNIHNINSIARLTVDNGALQHVQQRSYVSHARHRTQCSSVLSVRQVMQQDAGDPHIAVVFEGKAVAGLLCCKAQSGTVPPLVLLHCPR